MLSRKFYGAFFKFPEQTDYWEPSQAQPDLDTRCTPAVSVSTCPSAVASGFYQLYHFGPRLFIGSQFLKELTSLNWNTLSNHHWAPPCARLCGSVLGRDAQQAWSQLPWSSPSAGEDGQRSSHQTQFTAGTLHRPSHGAAESLWICVELMTLLYGHNLI